MSDETGSQPSKWKEPNIGAIYKKGDKHDPENYHPISLTSVICKIMESLVKETLLEVLKNKMSYFKTIRFFTWKINSFMFWTNGMKL